MKKKIAILGSTSSIGKSLLRIVEKNKKNFKIELLTANTNYKDLINQANNGAIEGVKILECSSNNDDFKLTRSQSQAFGSSIRRAIFRSSPLPLPSNETLFDKKLIIRITAN